MPKSFEVTTFGCKVNTYDSGLLSQKLSQHGFQETLNQGLSEIQVINTCAVTHEATLTAHKRIRQIKSKNPLATVVVTGCAAQVDTGHFSDLKGVDLIVANSHKANLPFILEQYFKNPDVKRGESSPLIFKSDIFKKTDLESGGGIESKHTRSFLKIQDGCNSFCTFCIIPFARGKSRSLTVEQLIRRVHELEDLGVKEVVVTGIHIGDYKDSKGRGLEKLMVSLLKQTAMPRFRISSLEPIEISQELLEIYSDSRMCPHFHLSIQSTHSRILSAMKRKYGQRDVVQCLHKLREKLPNCFIGMDVIAGFPGESEDDFLQTYQTLNETPWSRLHVFPFSERHGTYAARMKEVVPPEVRALRSRRLRALSTERFEHEARKQIGLRKSVLTLPLNVSQEGVTGVSEDSWNIDLIGLSHQPTPSQIVQVEVVEYVPAQKSKMTGHLKARVLNEV